jgi:hypothetical protein
VVFDAPLPAASSPCRSLWAPMMMMMMMMAPPPAPAPQSKAASWFSLFACLSAIASMSFETADFKQVVSAVT